MPAHQDESCHDRNNSRNAITLATRRIPDTERSEGNSKVLTLSSINPRMFAFQSMESLARGPVFQRALALNQEIVRKKAEGTTPEITEVFKLNLGDAHAMGQKPITFIRQVLALISCPDLIDRCPLNEDVKRKAKEILSSCAGESAGSYSESRGMLMIRKHVANFIQNRDGICSNPDDIVLTSGASDGIRICLRLFNAALQNKFDSQNIPGKPAGILVPVPEYPIYSVTLQEYALEKVNYFFDEKISGWSVNVKDLDKVVRDAREYCEPSAIVIINPGNPTGHVLSRENIEDIIRFAYHERLLILADEVYQDNVYGNKRFWSTKTVLAEMPAPYNTVELISFHSVSKGYVGECGARAGYFECVNIDPEVKAVLVASVVGNLCPSVLGQAIIDCYADPPKLGDPSYELYEKEKSSILNDLAAKAKMLFNELNSVNGMQCASVDGAMYAFPQITIPDKAIWAARELGQDPDTFYCISLLNATGICLAPGSNMGQMDGTYHFRTTLLPPKEKLQSLLQRIQTFHRKFMQMYA